MALTLVPITHAKAKAFIWKHHRHNMPSITAVFCIGLSCSEAGLVGVAMAGLPKARALMDGLTLEVTRVAVIEGTKNANSMIYGACARVALALGYTRLVTYTLPEESGSSLRAAGWTRDEKLAGGGIGHTTPSIQDSVRTIFSGPSASHRVRRFDGGRSLDVNR